MASFVERHGLWSAAQAEAAREVAARIERDGLELVRFAAPDPHGVLRGKALTGGAAVKALGSGVALTSTMLMKDTSHRSAFPVFTAGGGLGIPAMQGAADLQMVADPTTFRTLPWAPKTGWVLCDLYFPDGKPVPLATRAIYRDLHGRLEQKGYDFLAGLEVEFHLFRLLDPKLAPADAGQPGAAPEVELLSQGFQYLTEQRFDQMEPAVEIIRRAVIELGLPLRSCEIEMGPSQCEFTFEPLAGVAAADAMVLFRSAVKQIARRHGLHATFMCRPKLPNLLSSGWHLHQSLRARADGSNAFAGRGESVLSPLGMNWLAGLLTHARAGSLFATPTINGYRRYRAYSLAPDRVNWGKDNRGVMLRAIGQPGDPATRIENRIGEPTANPYLYMASQILAGLDGLERSLDPGAPAETPYETATPLLPKTLEEALAALEADDFHAEGFGRFFVDYLVTIKRAELARFHAEVSEWEQREYFDLF